MINYCICPLAEEPRQSKDQIQSLVIRINDIANICGEYDDFKKECCREYLKIEHLCE